MSSDLALGIAQTFHCREYAVVGRSSGSIFAHAPRVIGGVAYLSAGSNDPYDVQLTANLEGIRAKLGAEKVVWIIPYNRHTAAKVLAVARAHGDGFIDLIRYPGKPPHPVYSTLPIHRRARS